jgi:hydrogenase nickel incorporation protein HypA/HybF
MHEFGIMQEVVAMALSAARDAHANRIHRIRLKVGKLSGVIPEAMQFAHEVVVESTLAEGSDLEITETPAECFCSSCKTLFTPEKIVFRCPQCGTISSDLRAGRELEIIDIEIS